MGKKKNCDETLRNTIVNFVKRGWSYRRIADYLQCSKNMVFNAVQHVRRNKTVQNVPRKQRLRKTTPQEDRMMVRLAKADPFIGSVFIKNELFGADVTAGVSARTVRRRLEEAGLFGRIARKVPLLKKQHRDARLAFAHKYEHWTYSQWQHVLFSDETKVNLVSSDGRHYVRRPVNAEMNPRFTKKQVKHGGGNIKIWGSFSGLGVGPWNLDQFQYKTILEETMLPYAEEHLPVIWTFQHDNDPKHTARTVKTFLTNQSVSVLAWPANSPDLNPIEHLWHEIKKRVAGYRSRSLDELYEAFSEAWANIPVETCRKLISSMPRRCQAVIKNKGFATGY